MDAHDAVATFLAQVHHDFPDGVRSLTSYGYPDSLALCALDSVFSLTAHYSSTRRVVERYRTARVAAGADPELDGLGDLVAAIDAAGGASAAATGIFDNRQHAPGAKRLKAEALYGAAVRLADAGIVTSIDLREAAADPIRLAVVERAWRAERGLGHASWRYLLMLAGVPGVKIDRMISRYVTRALGGNIPKAQIEKVFAEASETLGVEIHELDHAIWRMESGRAD